MVFADLLFIFLFFAVCLTLTTFLKTNKARNIVLLVFSLVFYAWSGPWLLLILCGMTLVCYFGALRIEKLASEGDRVKAKKGMKLTLILTLVLCLGTLAFFKYTTFLVSEWNRIFALSSAAPNIVLPIGISFYTFQLITYVVDVYRGDVPAQKKYYLVLLYAALFHQCIAGPIVRYQTVADELENRELNLPDFSRGVTRFAVGLGKKVLLANADFERCR